MIEQEKKKHKEMPTSLSQIKILRVARDEFIVLKTKYFKVILFHFSFISTSFYIIYIKFSVSKKKTDFMS